MALFLVFISTTMKAQYESMLPLSINKIETKTSGLKGAVKCMRITQHQYDNESGESVVFEFVYEYNIQGNITKKEEWSQAEYEILAYDKTGTKIVSNTTYSKDDDHTISFRKYEYNKKGFLSKYSYFSFFEPNDTSVINYDYTYLKNGEVDNFVSYLESDSTLWTKVDLVYSNGDLRNIIAYGATKPLSFVEYGIEGKTKEVISYGNDGNIRIHREYKYDSNGNVEEMKEYNGENTDVTSYKYNEYGDCIIEFLPPVGKKRKFIFEGYDSYGNWTKKQWTVGSCLMTEVRKIEYYE